MKIGVVNAFSLPHIFRAPSTFHLCVNNRLNLFLQEGRRGGGGGRRAGSTVFLWHWGRLFSYQF